MNPANPSHLRLGALCFALPGVLLLFSATWIAGVIWRQAPARAA